MRIVFILLVLLLIPLTHAVIVDKPLNISVENCYSVNISAELTEGSVSDLQFVGCDKQDDTHFNCKCLNLDNNNFSIIMRTDNAIIRNLRQYDIYLSVNYIELYKKSMSVSVEDGGDYYQSWNKSWIDRNIKYKTIEKIVYINNTINLTKDNIIYKNVTIEHNNTIYINNTEYIENLTLINYYKDSIKIKNFSLIIMGLIILILVILFGLLKYNKIIY